MRVAIIGGGAAGFFALNSILQHHPDADVTLFEKSNKLLSKVKISGGGRCNATHASESISSLASNYPRGAKFLKKSFHQFWVPNTIDWFKERGVDLVEESDGRMFPSTNKSESIIRALTDHIDGKYRLELNATITSIQRNGEQWAITINQSNEVFDKVIIASGGASKAKSLAWLEPLQLNLVPPVPSLFTLNIHDAELHALKGLSVPMGHVKLAGSKLKTKGPILITHWGLSGPSVLKLSAVGALELADMMYDFNVLINWIGIGEEEVISIIRNLQQTSSKRVANQPMSGLPARLWKYLLKRADVNDDKPWSALNKKERNRLASTLTACEFHVKGKTTFKEEFVTAGGIDLGEVNPNTMELRKHQGVYAAGEVLNIDGVTGGFNFQAAWTTGFIAGKLTTSV